MRIDKIKNSRYIIGIAILSLFLTFITLTINSSFRGEVNPDKIEMSGFTSDFADTGKNGEDLYKGSLFRKEKYIAYSLYSTLSPGRFSITFILDSPVSKNIDCIFEIVSSKGKNVELKRELNIFSFPHKEEIILNLKHKKEIEPRIRFISGNHNVILKKVVVEKKGLIIPWKYISLKSLYFSPIIFFLVLTLFFIFTDDKRWKYSISFLLFYTGFFLVIRYAWVSEDAFITMRHVDNFLSGHGPVFNIGERVEGYTHTLWFYILSFLRAIGLSPKGAMVIPGVIFSGFFLYLMFFRFNRDEETNTPQLNFSGAVLIGMSCFIDFGTSGLETSLSYLLLTIFAFQIFKRSYIKKPFQFGITSTLLILNRPDFGIFFIFSIFLILFEIGKKRSDFKLLLRFLAVPVITLSAYEIFRMGYYGAVFPNPFYAKSGSASYFSQGFKYFNDLLKGSAFILILLMSLSIFLFKRTSDKKKISKRYILFSAAIFYAFFIIRGGGDFMHGRFLLPSVILLTLSSSGMFDNYFSKGRTKKFIALVLIVILFLVSRAVIPIQKRRTTGFVNGISDERYSFYKERIIPLNDICNDDIIFMWKTIGKNYNNLTKRSRLRIRIAYHTVGYIGYYSGKRVNVVDRLGLTDPVVSRIKIDKRGRPGHEKSAPFGYLMYRKLTFGKTPFPIWNKLASTQYGILWDLSRKTLNRFSFMLKPKFKIKIDKGIAEYINSLLHNKLQKNSDFLYFLKLFWVPYASVQNRALFNRIYNNKIEISSGNFRWIMANKNNIEKLDRVIKERLSLSRFFKNIIFATGDFL